MLHVFGQENSIFVKAKLKKRHEILKSDVCDNNPGCGSHETL